MAKINLSIFHNRQKRGTSQKEVSIELCFSTKGTRKDADELNNLLTAYTSRAHEVIEKLVKEGNYDLNAVISLMNGEDEGTSFIE